MRTRVRSIGQQPNLFRRGLIGLGAAFVMPATLSPIISTFPTIEGTKAVGFWAAVAGGSASLRPSAASSLLSAAPASDSQASQLHSSLRHGPALQWPSTPEDQLVPTPADAFVDGTHTGLLYAAGAAILPASSVAVLLEIETSTRGTHRSG